MRHKLIIVLACACALTGFAGVAALHADTGSDPEPPAATDEPATTPLDADLMRRIINRQRHETWRWQRIMGRPLTRALQEAPADPRDQIAAWHRLVLQVRRQAQNPPHKTAWLCIHHYEGSWTDPSPPYYGGLQMDLGFQARYGAALLRSKGTADHWTPLEQIWTAERARRNGRGFYPWPNTARYCGVL